MNILNVDRSGPVWGWFVQLEIGADRKRLWFSLDAALPVFSCFEAELVYELAMEEGVRGRAIVRDANGPFGVIEF